MLTSLLACTDANIRKAADCIKKGGLVAFPTETVYGLGANGLDKTAVASIFSAKQRPADNPLILHVSSISQAEILCDFTADAKTLAKLYWPGPLTMLLNKKSIVPDITTAKLMTVAVRMPRHPVALKLIEYSSCPIAAPSANRSGKPSPTTAKHVFDDMNGRVNYILDGGSSEVGLESTVIDMTSNVPCIYRPGAVTLEQISMVLGECEVSAGVMMDIPQNAHAPSPGMRHRHYAPKAPMCLIKGKPEAIARYIRDNIQSGDCILAMEENLHFYEGLPVESMGKNAQEAAHRLFYLLRQMDERNAKRIFTETLPENGLGLAVMNRLARAASFHIVSV